MQDLLLEVTGIEAGYGKKKVIKALDITVVPGSVLTITGSNGAGKSTLIRVLAGLQPGSFTSYRIAGKACYPESSLHRQMTHVITGDWMWLRNLSVYDHLSLWENHNKSGSVANAIDAFGLADCVYRMPYSLSSGQLQRAALASIMVRPWKVLFLDEPEQRLDDRYKTLLADLLGDLLPNRVIIAATHAPDLFTRLSSKTLKLGHQHEE